MNPQSNASHRVTSGVAKPPTPTKDEPPPAPPGTKQLAVPSDFIIYKAKISGGRIIDLPLPPKLNTSDVDRIHKLLLTQIDDEGNEGRRVEPGEIF
jgi:hypothetical protein